MFVFVAWLDSRLRQGCARNEPPCSDRTKHTHTHTTSTLKQDDQSQQKQKHIFTKPLMLRQSGEQLLHCSLHTLLHLTSSFLLLSILTSAAWLLCLPILPCLPPLYLPLTSSLSLKPFFLLFSLQKLSPDQHHRPSPTVLTLCSVRWSSPGPTFGPVFQRLSALSPSPTASLAASGSFADQGLQPLLLVAFGDRKEQTLPH